MAPPRWQAARKVGDWDPQFVDKALTARLAQWNHIARQDKQHLLEVSRGTLGKIFARRTAGRAAFFFSSKKEPSVTKKEKLLVDVT